MRYILIFFLSTYVIEIVHARPISYTGGKTIMWQSNYLYNKLHLHYSSSVNNSLGLALYENKYNTSQTINLQWNHLLLRHNTNISQTNIYLKSQLGTYQYQNNNYLNTEISIDADWETRRYFLAAATHVNYNSFDKQHYHGLMLRAGIAPYIAEYGSVHIWLMLQLEQHDIILQYRNSIISTPLIRIFYSDLLLEFGANSKGDAMLNGIYRF